MKTFLIELAKAENIIATAALITSIVSFLSSQRTTKITQGEIEFQMANLIKDSETRFADVSLQLIEYKDLLERKKKKEDEILEDTVYKFKYKLVNQAIESMLNAYEEACAKYLDKKIDLDRFKRSYHKDIRNLVENPQFTEYFNTPSTGYKCILKVYNQWCNLEDNQNKCMLCSFLKR